MHEGIGLAIIKAAIATIAWSALLLIMNEIAD